MFHGNSTYNHYVIGAMDTLARGLRSAVKLLEEGVLPKLIQVCLHVHMCMSAEFIARNIYI